MIIRVTIETKEMESEFVYNTLKEAFTVAENALEMDYIMKVTIRKEP